METINAYQNDLLGDDIGGYSTVCPRGGLYGVDIYIWNNGNEYEIIIALEFYVSFFRSIPFLLWANMALDVNISTLLDVRSLM